MKQLEIRLIISQSLVLRPFASKSLWEGVRLVINIYIPGSVFCFFLGGGNRVQESVFQNKLISQLFLMLIKISFLKLFTEV